MPVEPPDPGRIDLWTISLTATDPPLDDLAALLSPDEADRARRFVFQNDRDKFTRVRGLLRALLGRYLEIDPVRIEFHYAAAGKPSVSEAGNPTGLRFNVSHSGDVALIAVGFGRELGVDVELIRPGVDLHEVATHFFSPREVLELSGLPPEKQTLGFFNCWTRKEAYVKAIGAGLGFPLNMFDVSLRPGDPATLEVRAENAGQTHWTLRDVSPDKDYAAALVVEGDLEVDVLRRSATGPSI